MVSLVVGYPFQGPRGEFAVFNSNVYIFDILEILTELNKNKLQSTDRVIMNGQLG